MKKVTAVVLGAGNRGREAYASYALENEEEITFIGVAEPNEERRRVFQVEHNIEEALCFESWEDLLEKEQLADCILICMQDNMHYEPSMKAIEKGYHVLLEKPMSPSPEECVAIGEAVKTTEKAFSVCHVLRYTNFFTTIKEIIESGKIGDIMTIQHNEYVGYVHQSHSFVRGNWGNSKKSSPMILAKSCHDMDILLYLMDKKCVKISSFGELSHFKKSLAPKDAPKSCLDTCGVRASCIYDVEKIYLGENIGWPVSTIGEDMSYEGRYQILKSGPYGRCVYHCDNDVVDHQVVNMLFENGATASFTMTAFSKQNRTIKIMGTKGTIRGDMEKNSIEVLDRIQDVVEIITLETPESGHGGGDHGLMTEFVQVVASDNKIKSKTAAAVSVQSHLMAFAAEESRLEGKIVDMTDFYHSFLKR